MANEHLFIFGIEIEGPDSMTREEALRVAHGILEVGSEGVAEHTVASASYWHAEHDRTDGSDRDSAIFVPYVEPVDPVRNYGYVTGDWLFDPDSLLDDHPRGALPDDVDCRPRAYWAEITGYAAGGLCCRVSKGVAEIFVRDHQRLHQIIPTFDGVALAGTTMVVYRTEESGADPCVEEIRPESDGSIYLPGWTWFKVDDNDLDNYLLVG